MARNEKRETVELRWRRVGFVMIAVALIATVTVGYALQRRAHDVLGNQIKGVENQIEWTRASVRTQRENLVRLQRKDALLRQVAEMRLELTNIAPSQRRVVPLLLPSAPAVDTAVHPPGTTGPVLGPMASATAFPSPARR